MDRGFVPGGGFGGGFGRPFFRPFAHPFFPRRFLFPFFFFSPFFFPFFRDGKSDDMLFAQHQVQKGDTLAAVGHKYNMPVAILEEANPQLANPQQLSAGEVIYIPRISNMMCQKTYSEMPASMQQSQSMMQQG
ncbi:LysM peptidoglycan-binding domain-containing protein [Paenibacillus oenotherae]|uniref:LysM peptidoglycan-binding domain-containing protein n=1 Tax=Paenibacillus oenotherae TaxID=1435645 RepID=A0ABS7D2C1_9BACL|nr:LysM domain-containing protein [Paenibacillus oenotherae]MBW7474001.1 LysM peptidoglycan-binding domain-containing protein [Paenibacillus oenotherae]